MKLFLLGSGGREHALAWKLTQSRRCDELFIAPGNPGTAECGTNVDINPLDFAAIKHFIAERHIEMIVVGPEAPLVAGIYDFFEGEPVMIVGPSQQGAMLEGSKDFAKAFMTRHQVPTAAYRTFTKESGAQGLTYLDNVKLPVVLKADGLAAGKGVVICETSGEAKAEFQEMISGKFGGAGSTVIVEEFLTGREVSVFVLTDGIHYVLLPSAKDYKRIGEGDTGPNTGGMGAVSPVPYADEGFLALVRQRVVEPVISGLRKEGIVYKGILYCGLMKVGDEPFVIEFNCRLGDPETQVVMPRLESDLVDLFERVATGTLDGGDIQTDDRAACTVVLASRGYPGEFVKGKRITLPSNHQLVFHAGTSLSPDGHLLTAGGRVLAATALGKDHPAAVRDAMNLAETIRFDGAYYRHDIGGDI